MTQDWKKIATGAVGGIVAGLVAITVIGEYIADGDESFVFQDASQNTAVVISHRGGLFAHAHVLSQYCNKDGAQYDTSGNIIFTINSEVLHSHAEIADLYVIKKTHNECIITGGDSSNVSKTGGGHTHKLHVLAYIENDGTLTNYDASGNKI